MIPEVVWRLVTIDRPSNLPILGPGGNWMSPPRAEHPFRQSRQCAITEPGYLWYESKRRSAWAGSEELPTVSEPLFSG